jgi:hypothetical protein
LTAGTAMSFATGLLVMPNLVAAGVQGAAPYSLALTGISWAGIAGTYYATTQLDLEIVDTLLGLGGATLGGTALMITMAAALPAFGGVDPQLYTGVVTASGVVGILGGFVGTVAPLTWLRKNGVVGEPKDAAQALRVLPGGAPGAVVDMSGAVVATAPLVTLRW